MLIERALGVVAPNERKGFCKGERILVPGGMIAAIMGSGGGGGSVGGTVQLKRC